MGAAGDKLVFVSYSRGDRAFLDRELMPGLRNLLLNEQIELWNDQLIGVGDDWYAEIADRLDHAKVAILLVTSEFLGSKFCLHEEVPVLLQRARRGELRILPLYVEPCFWENEPWLSRVQMWPDPKMALSEYDAPARKRKLAEFTRMVRDAVEAPAQADQRETRFDVPDDRHDLHRLPQTGSLLFGRREEIKLLDTAWNTGATNVVVFTAGGGVGKSTLARVWAEMLCEDGWRGAERAFAWSFYSQGTGRMTDAESFLNEALKWFGADGWEGRSLWDRAERLAERIRQHRTLLILDGVEPLQSGEGDVDRGSIRDPGLRTLLEELAKGQPGLCVVTTRERLIDLAEFGDPAVLHQDLDQVNRLAGRALLRVDRVRGDDDALEAAVDDLGRHALAVALLGNLLKDGNEKPHISGASTLPPLEHAVDQGGHPRRVLDACARRLGDSAELELLHILGFFDRPVALDAVRAVIDGDALLGLNGHLRPLDPAEFDAILARLRDAKLVARASRHDDSIDTHPIVREHFGSRLKARHPSAWIEGHRRLYRHFKATAEHQPEDLEGMQPLFAAVVHGCAAGLHREACDEIYVERITRGRESFVVHKLGAIAADLSCLSHFFAERWRCPRPEFDDADQGGMIGKAGFRLRGLGRLREAVGAIEEAHDRRVAANNWIGAATNAGNLSQLKLALGELASAEAWAKRALTHVDRTADSFERVVAITTLADTLHQLGQLAESRTLFDEAERMQAASQPNYPFLYSFHGYLQRDLLLAEGETREVLRRATMTIEVATAKGWLLDIALDRVSLGRAHLASSPPDFIAAESHFDAAVNGLRAFGDMTQLPRGLLARAGFHRMRDDLSSARKDLDAVATLVRRHGLRLFEADLALERTRCHLAAGETDAARTTFAKARDLITAMGYGRRLPELAALEKELGGNIAVSRAAE